MNKGTFLGTPSLRGQGESWGGGVLYTPVSIPSSLWHIGYHDKVLMLGSCFADNIAAKMSEYYFQVTANPFGTLYNPLSIANALCLQEPPELVEYGGLWHSMYHHGEYSAADKDTALARCRESIRLLQKAFQEATVVIITFGTAWVYEQDGQVVANCHKMPANLFTRRRLTINEIVSAWQSLLSAHPDKHFIFTVSPIRHIKDGLHENQLSKATLLLAVEQLVGERNTKVGNIPLSEGVGGVYFPSYEILLDELRDYRFYADDMVHPTSLAVNYIFERFVNTYMTATTQSEMRTLHQLYLDRHHTILHPDSLESQKFTRQLKEKESALRLRYPWL